MRSVNFNLVQVKEVFIQQSNTDKSSRNGNIKLEPKWVPICAPKAARFVKRCQVSPLQTIYRVRNPEMFGPARKVQPIEDHDFTDSFRLDEIYHPPWIVFDLGVKRVVPGYYAIVGTPRILFGVLAEREQGGRTLVGRFPKGQIPARIDPPSSLTPLDESMSQSLCNVVSVG